MTGTPSAKSPAPKQAPDVRIGAKLRAARQGRRMTLEQLANAAGLSKGYISRLERDDVSPSVASLVTVCDVIGLRVGELFEPPRQRVVRAGEGREIDFGGQGVRECLVSADSGQRLDVIHSVIEPGGNGGKELYALHVDVECVYVIRGTMTVQLTDESHVLHPGDALTFDGGTPHTWQNASAEPAEVLWMLAPGL